MPALLHLPHLLPRCGGMVAIVRAGWLLGLTVATVVLRAVSTTMR